MKPRWLFLTLILCLSVLTGLCPAQTMDDPPQFCATEHPEDVLQCLTQAYMQRDVMAYGRLFSTDYAAYHLDNPNPIANRAVELAAVKAIFNPDSVKTISLTFSKDFVVAQGDSSNLWIIREVTAVMSLDAIRKGELQHYEVTTPRVEVKVRRVDDPVPHFQIYRWWARPEE